MSWELWYDTDGLKNHELLGLVAAKEEKEGAPNAGGNGTLRGGRTRPAT